MFSSQRGHIITEGSINELDSQYMLLVPHGKSTIQMSWSRDFSPWHLHPYRCYWLSSFKSHKTVGY